MSFQHDLEFSHVGSRGCGSDDLHLYDCMYVRAGPFKLSWAHAMFIGCAALNLLSVRAMDTVMLHVLLNGYGWGAL